MESAKQVVAAIPVGGLESPRGDRALDVLTEIESMTATITQRLELIYSAINGPHLKQAQNSGETKNPEPHGFFEKTEIRTNLIMSNLSSTLDTIQNLENLF